VKPLPDEKNAFICNVGDLCERWTNGVFKSTVHRVVTTADLAGRGNKRHSCAFFWEPDFDTFVEPLPACVAENPPRRYEPTTYGEYILAKYRATHADFEKR
jgi:isopenicillin N synthase-like dioxygenase